MAFVVSLQGGDLIFRNISTSWNDLASTEALTVKEPGATLCWNPLPHGNNYCEW